MKLISCHIKNFGKLSNFDYKFNDGITSIIDNNGTGKSTLASFIKAMIYGMDGVKSNDKDFKDRTHYAPFNCQSYGGTLIFTHNKKEYRIERTFDVKSAAKDDIKIYVDKELVEFDKEIGEEILGLDRDSFDRLLFISSKDIKMESNGNIRKNLNNIIDDTTTGVDFEIILEKLSTIEKRYSTKKNSDTYNLKEKKKNLDDIIINQEKISNALTKKYEQRNKLNNKLIEYNNKQQVISDKKMIKECWDTYNGMIDEINQKEKSLTELLIKYPNGYPASIELSKLYELIKKETSLAGESKGIIFDESKKQKLDNLKNKFPNGIPTDLEMENLKGLTEAKSDLLSKKYGITFADSDKERLEKYIKEFKNGIPTEESISEIENKIKEYDKVNTVLSLNNNELTVNEKDIINKYDNKNPIDDLKKVDSLINEYKSIDETMKVTPKFEENAKPATKKVSKVPVILLLLSIVLLGAGIGTFFVMLSLGVAFTAIGVIGIFASAFLYLKGKIDSNATISATKTNALYTKQEELLRTKADDIHKLLTPYGIYTDSVFSDFEKFKNEYARYNEIKEKVERSSVADKTNREKAEALKKEISLFLSIYLEYSSFSLGIQKLKEDIKTYEDLKTKYDKYVKDNTENTSAIKQIDIDISNITINYKIILSDSYKYNELILDVNDYKRLNNEYNNYLNNISANKENLAAINKSIKEYDDKYTLGLLNGTSNLNTINSDVLSINSLKKDIEIRKEDANKYKIEKNLIDEDIINNDEQIDFSNEIDALKSEIATLDLQIDSDERDIDSLEDNKQQLEEVKQKIKENEHKFDVLTKLEVELRKSQKGLDDKYVAPIMDKFEYYSKLLGDLLDEKIVMGREFDIKLDVDGQLKSDEHLSSGQRSICALCFRLALLDNIYNGDVPFIIMDDPFIALDDTNLIATAKMLEKLSKGKQIIYFSCHKSRTI